jgi:peroxiredoxin (alkyl hydroperoxide reductase subunit C)
MVETIQVGQTVPDFTLETYNPVKGDFDQFNLKANMDAGKWTYLFFYPADFTFVCATEFAALAKKQDDFSEKGVEIVTVSSDTKFVHRAWHENEGALKQAKYQMGADPTGAVGRLFGCYVDEAGVSLRGAFLIAPDGTLLNAEVNFLNLGRNVDEWLRKLRANIYLAKNTAEGIPAEWQEDGDVTLKPCVRMVGHVEEALGKGGEI